MMCSIQGRIKIAVVVSFALVVILGLCFTQAGFTWGQTSAARAAVLAFLKQVPPPQPQPDPQVAGREATPEEAAALDEAINAYLRAIRAREYAAAWDLMTNVSPGATQETFVEGLRYLEELETEALCDGASLLMGAYKTRLVELEAYDYQTTSPRTYHEEYGTAHITIEVSQPLWLALVNREGTWRIDSLGGERAAAREGVTHQLDEISRNTADSTLRQMLRKDLRGAHIGYLTLLVLSPQTATHKIIIRKVDADNAVVKLQTQGVLHALIPLTHDVAGWRLDLNAYIQLVASDFRLSDRKPTERAVRMDCIRNLKQLALGMLSYCQDYDEKLPPADKWSSGISPYVKNQQTFNCPAVETYGYATNYKLSRQTLGQLQQPANTIMLFDSTLLRPNAYDVGTMPGVSLPEPPRHKDYNNLAYVDGHVRSVDWRPDLGYYKLEGPPSPPPPPGGPANGPGGPPAG